MTRLSPRSDGDSPRGQSSAKKSPRTFRANRVTNKRDHDARNSSAASPFPCISTPDYYDPIRVVARPNFLPLLLIPDPGPLASGPAQNGDDMAVSFQQSEAVLRGTRMLRTALGPAIAGFLEDPSIVEVVVNPDGRLWVDRLSGGWRIRVSDCRLPTGSASSGWSLIMSAPKFTAEARVCQRNCPERESVSRACCRLSWPRRRLRSASRPSPYSACRTMWRPASCRPTRRRYFAAPSRTAATSWSPGERAPARLRSPTRSSR